MLPNLCSNSTNQLFKARDDQLPIRKDDGMKPQRVTQVVRRRMHSVQVIDPLRTGCGQLRTA